MTFLGIPLLVWCISLGLLFIVGLIAIVPDLLRERRWKSYSGDLVDAGELRARMRRSVRPTLLLVPATAPGFSKIGGLPDLPAAAAWPIGLSQPRAFVAQVDLATFQGESGIDWLPIEGRLYLFFDDDRNGWADCVTVTYSVEPPGAPREPPQPIDKRWRFQERRVAFMKFNSVPSLDWLDIDPAALPDRQSNEDWSTAFADCDLGDEIEHRIGGYPSELQGGQMQLECEYLYRGRTRRYDEPVPEGIRRAAREWWLLFQIDSDPALGMNWWDAGRLYIFVRKRDALRGDFSRTVTITQTY